MSLFIVYLQTDCDVEWKFARTGLWMNYIDEGGTVPVPFNMIPTPKSGRYIMRWMRAVCRNGSGDSPDDDDELMDSESTKKQTFIKVNIRQPSCDDHRRGILE